MLIIMPMKKPLSSSLRPSRNKARLFRWMVSLDVAIITTGTEVSETRFEIRGMAELNKRGTYIARHCHCCYHHCYPFSVDQ